MKIIYILLSSFFVSILFAQEFGKKTLGLYTSVEGKHCALIDSSELLPEAEIDFSKKHCPGIGGYDVEVSGGDIRYNIKLGYGGTDIPLPHIPSFHDLGSKVIEWRFSREEGGNNGFKKMKLWALIYRIRSFGANSRENFDTLYVVRLREEKSCAVAAFSKHSNPNADLNKLALEAAEDETLPCLKIENLR